MADNLLDQLIADQNARGLRPASAAQIAQDPNYVPPVTIVPGSGMLNFSNQSQTPYTVQNVPGAVAPASSMLNWGGLPPGQQTWNVNPAQLRQQLNLDELTTRAAQHKFDLERSYERAPLEDQYLRAQIDAQGAHDRFLKSQDAQVYQHTTGFLNDLSHPNAPGPHDPGYPDHVLRSLVRNPRFAETPGGQKLLQRITDSHDTHLSMADIKKSLPAGYDIASVSVGPKGQSVKLKPVAKDVELEKDAKNYGLTLGQIRNPIQAQVGKFVKDKAGISKFEGDEAGDVVQIRDKEGKTVSLSTKEYERLGGTYSPEGSAKRGIAPAADLSALAREALADPNATEAEKLAARKRLGL